MKLAIGQQYRGEFSNGDYIKRRYSGGDVQLIRFTTKDEEKGLLEFLEFDGVLYPDGSVKHGKARWFESGD